MASGGDMEEVVVSMSKASIEVEVKEEVGKKKKIDRHCGFCLTLVPGDEVKVCSKCKRRAYCSQQCQKADWKETWNAPAFNGTIHGFGQGHKNWCGLPYGEEDLDWKVVRIEGKGLGIVALRDIPYLYRILVEGMQHPPGGSYTGPPQSMIEMFRASCSKPQSPDERIPYTPPTHPALSDLHSHPANSDISAKFLENQVESIQGLKVGLRLSRINHSCRPNAAFTVYPTFAVFVVCAEREIKAGEEISRCYLQGKNFPFQGGPGIENVVLTYKTPEECREEYSIKWGFSCPPSCACRDEKNAKLLEELQKMVEYCVKNPLKKPALEKIQKVVEHAKEFGIGGSIQQTYTCWRLTLL